MMYSFIYAVISAHLLARLDFLLPMDKTNCNQLSWTAMALQLNVLGGAEDVVNLCDYMHHDFLAEHAKIMETASFPPISHFPFSPDVYGDGIKSVNKLPNILAQDTSPIVVLKVNPIHFQETKLCKETIVVVR